MLTDEDIKRIGAEFTKRMIDNRISENRQRRRNKQKSAHTDSSGNKKSRNSLFQRLRIPYITDVLRCLLIEDHKIHNQP